MSASSPQSSPLTPSFSIPSTNTTPPNDTALLKAAYATLITTPSYLPGALLLAHTLKEQNSQFPLILMYTGLPASYIPHLQAEAKHSNILLHETQLLNITTNPGVAERFAHTWTKLQVFSLYRGGWDRICFLDADMMIRGPMDDLLLHVPLTVPGVGGEEGKRLAATHVCVCNLEKDSWAPSDWTQENCAYTSPITAPSPFQQPSKPLDNSNSTTTATILDRVQHVPPSTLTPTPHPQTHTLLNSGLFVFNPSPETWDSLWEFIHTHKPLLNTYQFPDQDLLTDWWRDRWISVGWKYNALKTWRYWHPEMWDDEGVHCLHYIVDKPWSARVPTSGVAGYKGNDGVTHGWWWDAFAEWEKKREDGGKGDGGVLELVRGLVAPPLVED